MAGPKADALTTAAAVASEERVRRIDEVLPQTQCTRCGYPDCQSYARAIANGAADINRCPPGGAEGVRRLAQLTGLPAKPLDPSCGREGPLRLAVIDEAWCIGCTLCIRACPVDCIVGAPRRMHTVIESLCTGCELCLPVCPVDCIAMLPDDPSPTPATGWDAWSPAQAATARTRYAARQARAHQRPADDDQRLLAKAEAKLENLPAHTRDEGDPSLARKRAVVEAAMARARARLAAREPLAAAPAEPS
jgi:electron transport complex protein RnfB